MSDEFQEPSTETTRRDMILGDGQTREQSADADKWMGKEIEWRPGRIGTVIDVASDYLIVRPNNVIISRPSEG